MGNKLRFILITVIVIVWAADSLASFLVPSYQLPQQFDSAVATLVGALLLTYRKNDGDDDKE